MIDPIVIGPWNSTFNRPRTQWEFTANAVGIYDNTAGKVVSFLNNRILEVSI